MKSIWFSSGNTRKSLQQLTQFSSESYVAGWEEWTRRLSRSIDAQEGSFEGNNVQTNSIGVMLLFYMSTKSLESSRSDQVRYEVDNRRNVAIPGRGKSNSPPSRSQLRPADNPIQWAPTRLPRVTASGGSVDDNLHLMGRQKKYVRL